MEKNLRLYKHNQKRDNPWMIKNKNERNQKKMKKYILTLGLNDKNTCKPAFSESKAVEMICNLLLQRGFKGASITSGRGFYQMESTGETVFEDFIKIEFMLIEVQKVIDFASVLKAVFNQESIAFETVNTDSILL